mmetsp:Transcript_44100/g.71802  ORF Transcript_44100/g.71802 Transcript_44100/m.71802 type:complete len:149 (-) Transcript_44100:143-589(-)|eukprot:CAMPEP_0184345948 /NCGR_PEP_ID=MMETSP1089-20130417/14274_1 /TAXON_ID=38269 ORGANISM="Gloeochaete wittrockiana, Strain SAG46.84" /NCGR_SAMPLE_ID=MMETSP1089 /ASSEMBLY_ACC=CAM_ASM_000445 /LENGTH=148 /DNA_ID=CAMNT_0026676431 /DNA_START=66 /DNA_END=512 /DNA_ORIENTATION=+
MMLRVSNIARRLGAARNAVVFNRGYSDLSEAPVKALTGVPEEHLKRVVHIYQPTKTAMQQGRGFKTTRWKIDFPQGAKWVNPLMGWVSTNDPLSQTSLYFDTKDAAIAYAEKYGFVYELSSPHKMDVIIHPYANNFKWRGPPPQAEEL